ncbi:HET-domain-containing protein, partial [Glonium stellatum]
LMTCRNEHTTCERVRLQSQSSWAPTRLIYIDRQSGSLKLEESDTIPLGVRYTTLSHCWGRVPDKLVLTVANVASWKHALPSLGKMKTFEDAIEISQRLGVPYIWIDSLCIIQDSRDDWIAESSRMSDVYKYSFCNICATAAADDTGGCFFSRDPSIALPFRIQATAMDQSSRSLQGAYDLHRQGKWVLEIGGAPVNRRAWVVQERFLTPRVLNFGKSQLYWECNELQASESYPDGVPKEPNGDVMFKATTPFNLIKRDYANSDTSNTSNASYGLDDLFGLWAVAVDAFTGCGLTKEEDKLVAISAIAREMQPLMQCRYLAGHWEVDFVRQLAWTALNFSYRASVYRAPSWSWASVDGIIDHFQ